MKEMDEYKEYKALCAMIILQAFRDYKSYKDKKYCVDYRDGVTRFLKSEYGQQICDFVGISADRVLKKCKEGSKGKNGKRKQNNQRTDSRTCRRYLR